jgi:hypothetical protein
MMVAYARAHVIKYAVFEVETVEYNAQVTKVRLVPDTPTQTLRVMEPASSVVDADSPVWTLELAGIQDFGVGSLGAALRTAADAGTDLDVEFQPKTGVGQDRAVFSIRPVNIPFGGDQGAFRTFDVTVPVVGTPVFSQSV